MADMENCPHLWEYDGKSFDDVFVRCPVCGMVRLATKAERRRFERLNRPQRTRPEDGERYER